MKRKDFLVKGLSGIGGIYALGAFGSPMASSGLDVIDVAIVKEFVVAGHNDLDKVQQMLSEEANLIHARHDWGGGDFEEAIEGAGHVGNKEIANYLIRQGARVNLFVLTMLGQSEIVMPALEAYPELIRARGPHGFSLLHHAKIGGEESKEIHDYLLEKGLSETKFN